MGFTFTLVLTLEYIEFSATSIQTQLNRSSNNGILFEIPKWRLYYEHEEFTGTLVKREIFLVWV